MEFSLTKIQIHFSLYGSLGEAFFLYLSENRGSPLILRRFKSENVLSGAPGRTAPGGTVGTAIFPDESLEPPQ